MNCPLIIFAVIAVLCSVVLSDPPRGPLIHHHSLTPPYIADWWQEGIPHWEVGGDAVATDSFVRLTPQRLSRVGWLWNTQPNDNPNWEMRAKLAIGGKRSPGADGMALWYVEKPSKADGPIFGLPIKSLKGLGIIFDSYDNDGLRDNPAVSVLMNVDGSKTEWNLDQDLRHDSAFRCQFDFRKSSLEDPVEVTLSYFDKKLSLRLRIVQRGIDVFCGELSGVEVPMGYYFGATAATGGMVDNHDVVSIELRGLGDDAIDHSMPVEHFDNDADARDRSFWGPQQRTRPR